MGRKTLISTTNDNAENQISSNIKEYIHQKVLSSEISIKKYFDTRLELCFDKLNIKISQTVDEKYRLFHSRTEKRNVNESNEGVPKEDVLTAIELAINETNIENNLGKYMDELKQLR
jgi:signal recognition particle subunit SEC65